jgi:Mg2+ and Co2+ transporter CorA
MIPHCAHTRPTPTDPVWIAEDGVISENPQIILTPDASASPRPKERRSKNAISQPATEPRRKKRTRKRKPSTGLGVLLDLKNDSASDHHPHPFDIESNDGETEDELEPRHGNIALFMPYLHFESHERRLAMAETIKSVSSQGGSSISSKTQVENPDEVMLVKAYLNSAPSLHPRRTLDQFLYHSFDTEKRDVDQVVYRYLRDKLQGELKVYMVDQLWLWIWGEDLIVTSFPQRWGQVRLKNDPLCVLEGVMEDINSKTRPPVRSVHDLAMVITGRCSGGFDRHRIGDPEFQFMDMYDSSIGDLSVKEPELFEAFEMASSEAADWLREQQTQRETEKGAKLNFVNNLLDIKKETTLLKELKDIRDELNIIKSIFSHQHKVLHAFKRAIHEERQEDKSEVAKRFREQSEMTKLHSDDVRRMDYQAQAIFTSLTQLLDFKQKHANAIEARFAREQAEFTAGQADLTRKQGETIMVFTIVTILFLPMSFVAAFFTINITDNHQLSLGYVSRYVFGIGLSISFVFIAVAFQVNRIQGWRGPAKHSTSKSQLQVDATNMITVQTPPALMHLQRNDTAVFAPATRVLSEISTITGRSAASAARNRYGDPELGRR